MKKFNRFVLCATLLSTSFLAHAEVSCPSVSTVKNIKFATVFPNTTPGTEGFWHMYSDAFTENDQGWNVWFGAYLPGVYTFQDAKVEGEKKFHELTLATPTMEKNGNVTLCKYSFGGENYVVAVNPPQFDKPNA